MLSKDFRMSDEQECMRAEGILLVSPSFAGAKRFCGRDRKVEQENDIHI